MSEKKVLEPVNTGIAHPEQAQINVAKYGEKNDDVIARAYREDKRIGDIWCAKNAEKYLRRFIGKSPKSNNFMDLLKVQDYVNRMVEANREYLDQLKQEDITEKA